MAVIPMVVRIVTVAVTVMMAVTTITNVHDRAAYDHRTRIRIHVDDAWALSHDGRISRVNLAPVVTGAGIIHCDANQRASSCTDYGALNPMVIVVSTNQSARHCPQNRRSWNGRRPINFSLRGTGSSHRK